MIIIWLIAVVLFMSFGLVVLRGAPYVPSHRREVERALSELYPLGPGDVLVDIGSGDGVVLREAGKRGARAVGYELNPFLAMISRLLSWRDGRVNVHLADAWLSKYPPETTVVYIFSVTRDMPRLQTRLQRHVAATGKSVALICYGDQPKDLKPTATLGAHGLYMISPLHDR